MKASEAIKWLKGIDKKYIHGGDEGFDNSRKVAISTAISALEKQIMKKPVYKDVGNVYGALQRKCSVCGDVCMISEGAKPFERYCRYCGNKLEDWSDTE